MISIISGGDAIKNPNTMDQVWRLRHEIFVMEKKWHALDNGDGREIDQFDNSSAIHMLAWEGEELVGYQRMLPTTGPYLLSEIYPELCEYELPRSKNVWEWTRFAVPKAHRSRGRMLSPVSNELLSAIVEWGLKSNVTSIVIEMNPLWLLRLVQLHFRVVPLGICQKLDDEEVLAVKASFDTRTLNRLQELRGNNQQVLIREFQ